MPYLRRLGGRLSDQTTRSGGVGLRTYCMGEANDPMGITATLWRKVLAGVAQPFDFDSYGGSAAHITCSLGSIGIRNGIALGRREGDCVGIQ